MIEFLKSWIINIITIVLFIVLLEVIIPSGRIKKFVNLVSGLVLIIAIINPLLNFLGRRNDLIQFQFNAADFIDRKEIEKNSQILEDDRMKQIVNVYREKIVGQIESVAAFASGNKNAKADVIINDDYKSKGFGEIRRVYIYLQGEGGNLSEKRSVNVGKITVGREESKPKENNDVDTETRKKLIESIKSTFGVDEENIVISFNSGEGE